MLLVSRMRTFDRKFGKDFVAEVPPSPGVYRILDSSGSVIYVGKAKNLRRRLAQYRNAKRRKKHAKMRSIVKDSDRIEFEVCPSELAACLLEAKLIQELRPKWNVAGAFYFLYPMIGVKRDLGAAWFCLTTKPEEFPDYRFHGAYRSRLVTGNGFFALMEILPYVGHPVPRKKLGPDARKRYSYVFAFRQIPEDWVGLLEQFFRGESPDAMEHLVLALIENAHARRHPRQTQELLDQLKAFWRHEARSLRSAIKGTGFLTYPVPQKERDIVFLRHRMAAFPVAEGAARTV